MTETNPPRQITNFDELIQMYRWHATDLKSKEQESYWLRYLFRRLSLFFGFGLIFFFVCLALAMNNAFGGKIDYFLHDLIVFDVGFRDQILIGSIVLLLLRSFFPWKWFNNKTWTGHWEKPTTLLLILSLLLSGFSLVISQHHALFLGLSIFSVVTFGSLLADRMLGFTRRNERYQLFSNRAEGLIIENRSRKTILDKSGKTIQFNEEHLLECSAFFEELRLDKYNAAMRDSFYLLRLKEKLLGRVT